MSDRAYKWYQKYTREELRGFVDAIHNDPANWEGMGLVKKAKERQRDLNLAIYWKARDESGWQDAGTAKADAKRKHW